MQRKPYVEGERPASYDPCMIYYIVALSIHFRERRLFTLSWQIHHTSLVMVVVVVVVVLFVSSAAAVNAFLLLFLLRLGCWYEARQKACLGRALGSGSRIAMIALALSFEREGRFGWRKEVYLEVSPGVSECLLCLRPTGGHCCKGTVWDRCAAISSRERRKA